MKQEAKSRQGISRCLLWTALLMTAGGAVSCRTVYDAKRTDPAKQAEESSLVFVRPDRFTLLGTRSIRDYVEVTYETAKPNTAGLLTVQAGFRNRGGQRWYDRKGPDFALSVKTTFYEEAVPGQGVMGPPVYETPWSPLPIARGDTAHYKATCLIPSGRFYQITVSEFLEHKNR